MLTLGISGFPFENPETKCHLDVGLVGRHRGEVVACPKSRPW